jgi:hypothetical protein
MTWQLDNLNLPQLTGDALDRLLDRLTRTDRPRHRRLWAYFRNPIRFDEACPHRPYRQAQEWGLPTRITGVTAGSEPFQHRPAPPVQRKEIVIENDIGWRIETMVEYLFGKPLVIRSSAANPERRALLDKLIQAILEHNGGILFLQQVALLGAIHGFVDVLVKLDQERGRPRPQEGEAAADGRAPNIPGQRLDEHPRTTASLGRPPASSRGGADASSDALQKAASGNAASAAPVAEQTAQPASPSDALGSSSANPGNRLPLTDAQIQRLARMIRLEVVEPARAVPLLANADYRTLEAYIQHYELPGLGVPPSGGSSDRVNAELRTMAGAARPRWWQRWLRNVETSFAGKSPETSAITEIITPTAWQRYADGKLTAQGENSLGIIPLVHMQNTPVPFEYSGASDVEPLIPLQDELNTRLCDRAHRIALQSFKMYLARGIENFHDLQVGPGQMWSTFDTKAGIEEFGGDTKSPSEEAHIADLREALDKTSGVSPIAAGAIKDRVGRLTSAAALRITLISLLSRTDRKRTTYGFGITRMIELSLRWLDLAGAFPTTPEEREIEINWPSPLPENEAEKLSEAEIKLRLGVKPEIVLRELGY